MTNNNKVTDKLKSSDIRKILINRESPRGIMVETMDCGIVVNKFEIQSGCSVLFRTNTLGKCMNPLILPAIIYACLSLTYHLS